MTSLPAEFAATRSALHAVAEHVVAPARYQSVGRIGLRVATGGFGTPAFGDGEVVRVDGTDLVYERPGEGRRAPLTTLRAAASFVGVELGAPLAYAPTTDPDPDMLLSVDPAAAQALADWYAFLDAVLAELVAEHPDATDVTLWPEHFDLATSFADANFGGSPGDAAIEEPYLYAGPWSESRRTGEFGAYPWGAAATFTELQATGDPVAAAREFFARAAGSLLLPNS